MTSSVPAVSMRHITRRFGPVVANDDVSLDLPPGEARADGLQQLAARHPARVAAIRVW